LRSGKTAPTEQLTSIAGLMVKLRMHFIRLARLVIQAEHLSWLNSDFQDAVATRSKEIVRFDDLIELETVGDQRGWIKAL